MQTRGSTRRLKYRILFIDPALQPQGKREFSGLDHLIADVDNVSHGCMLLRLAVLFVREGIYSRALRPIISPSCHHFCELVTGFGSVQRKFLRRDI